MRVKDKAAKLPTGRPPFVPTKPQQHKVASAAGAGMTHEQIAMVLGICRNTLETYFAFELGEGACKMRFEIVEAMRRQAKKGNVAAAKFYLALTARAPSAQPDEAVLVLEPEPEGKKAQANAAALTASDGTKWDRLLKPKQLQ